MSTNATTTINRNKVVALVEQGWNEIFFIRIEVALILLCWKFSPKNCYNARLMCYSNSLPFWCVIEGFKNNQTSNKPRR